MKKHLLILFSIFISGISIAQNGCQEIIQLILSNSTEETIETDPNTGEVTVYYDLCPGETLTLEASAEFPENNTNYFQSIATTNFSWHIDEVEESNNLNFSHTFNDPGGHIISLRAKDVNNCLTTAPVKVFVRVSITPNFDLSTEPSSVCPGVATSIGATGDLIFSSEIETGEWSVEYSNTFSNPLFIPDGPFCPPGVYETSIEFNTFLPGQTLNNIDDLTRICIKMEHSYVGDFTIKLISPNGSTTVLLADENDVDVGNGLISHDLGEPNVTTTGPTLCDPASNPPGVGYIYCWSPNPTVTSTWHELNTAGTLNSPIDASVIATNTNIYKAYDDSFNQILNTPLNGDWTIEVTDSYENDNGWIFQWWIDFNPEITPTSWSFNNYIVDEYFLPEPSIISNNDSSITIEPEPGIHNYSYEVVDNFNCTYSDEITITTPPYVVAYFMQNQDTVVYNNGLVKFTNFSSPDPQTNLVFNQWSFGDGQSSTEEQPKHDFNQIGTYSVQLTVTNEIGCADSYSSEVVAIEDYFVWTPTAFTPNGDGTNDIYKPILKNIIESSFELFIYDRWGKLVYQSNEIDSGWDGIRQDNGIFANIATYSFFVRFNTRQNELQEKTGSFVLLN